MAGLGTGAAPFRAFLQHLAWLAQKGEEIGPVYYYFGSRYQGAEYLYGEEIEAFVLDGVITRAGLAFSRDGKKKVYIQHKMLEDSEALAKMLHDEEGVFYLCGPTWPVPDVYEALVNALVKYKGSDPVKAGAYLESLKEDERYVLEVAIIFYPPRSATHPSIIIGLLNLLSRIVKVYIPEVLRIESVRVL
jgi:sulfite reductase (NADPH) flavoprotein alpha-component